MAQSVAARFWAKVDRRDDASCWQWTGARTPHGYGELHRHRLAHRLSYELHHGPIPEGAIIHHECGNPLCVNPAHLKVLASHKEHRNLHADENRPTECPAGHSYTPENTYHDARGAMSCRECRRARSREYQHQRRRNQ